MTKYQEEYFKAHGEDLYLSGIQRSAFHGTATREVMGGEFRMVYFDSSALWK